MGTSIISKVTLATFLPIRRNQGKGGRNVFIVSFKYLNTFREKSLLTFKTPNSAYLRQNF